MTIILGVLAAAVGSEAIWQTFAANGPWAAVAGFLLFTVIKAWERDRAQTLSVMEQWQRDRLDTVNALASMAEVNREMVQAVTGLRLAVEALTREEKRVHAAG